MVFVQKCRNAEMLFFSQKKSARPMHWVIQSYSTLRLSSEFYWKIDFAYSVQSNIYSGAAIESDQDRKYTVNICACIDIYVHLCEAKYFNQRLMA